METTTEKKATKRTKVKKDAVLQENVKPTEEKPNRKPVKKPDNPREWLQKYIQEKDLSTSSARQITWLLSRPQGASIKECVQRCIEIGEMKGNNCWGRQPGAIKAHINGYLKQKGVTVTQLGEDHYKISA